MFLSSLPRTTTTFMSTLILARTFIKHLVSIDKIRSAHKNIRFSVSLEREPAGIFEEKAESDVLSDDEETE
jgi:hypothetical protein